MATVASPPVVSESEQRVVLRDISWTTYECLLADDEDRHVPRLTYDRGVMEIVSPSAAHEEDADTLRIVAVIVAAALAIPIKRLGSTTYRRADLEQGFEPDGSFYIQNEPLVHGKRRIDLTVDPPPDLVIELDVSRSSLDKLALLARMGVPEVWRYDGQRVTIFLLAGATYQESAASLALPPVTGDVLMRFLTEGQSLPNHDWLRSVNDWVRAQQAPDGPAG